MDLVITSADSDRNHERTSKGNYYRIWREKNDDDDDLLKTCRNISKMVPVCPFRFL